MSNLNYSRVASFHLLAQWERVAKPQYLKALDFVAGLIRKFQSLGLQVSMDIPNETLLRRVIQMRKLVQEGFDLSSLATNSRLMTSVGDRILRQAEEKDSYIEENLPDIQAQKAFFKTYPDREGAARVDQARLFRAMIRRELGSSLSDSELDSLVLEDRAFFSSAFEVANSHVVSVKNQVAGDLSGSSGKFQIRDKAEQSAWDKSRKKKQPFYLLGDLLGCRTIVNTVPDLCLAAYTVQKSLDILSKDNRYARLDDGYNALHYALGRGGVVIEYQVKTYGNFLEASISHDLLHSDEKFRVRFPSLSVLSPAQKKLVRLVVDVSSQLSSRDWGLFLRDPEFIVGGAPEGRNLLYEAPEGRSVLAGASGSTRSQILGVLRLASWGLISI